MSAPKIVDQKTIRKGFLTLTRYDVLENRKIQSYECLERGESVGALILNTLTKKFIFTQQFRVGSKSKLIEIPAGGIEPSDKSPEEALRREILEETGYACDRLEPLGSYFSSPGGTSERIHLFYVEVSKKTAAGGGTSDENIEIIEIDENQIHEFQTPDLKTTLTLAVHLGSKSAVK